MAYDGVVMGETKDRLAVLFVCMGNICRSPTAEGVFRRMVEEAGLSDRVRVDSAGTHDYHVGAPPDRRAQAAAERRGYDLSSLRARKVDVGDCRSFDYVLVMDRGNLNRARSICGGFAENVRLLMDFAPGRREREVPDPYVGGPEGFEYVLDLIEEACRGLLEDVKARLAGEGARV